MKKYLALVAVTLALFGQSVRAAEIESRSLDQIHKEALKEGGTLVVYAGGDTPNQLDGIKTAFEKRFPGMTLEVVVDYSKVHNARLDQQFADGKVVADVVQLQTLQDFPRWRREGRLLPYKPRGWGSHLQQLQGSDRRLDRRLRGCLQQPGQHQGPGQHPGPQ